MAVACGELREDVRATLLRVQNDLFDVGADLCTPLAATYEYPPLRVQDAWVDELEADCDRYNDELEKLRSFILPGGTPGLGLPARGPHGRAARRALRLGRAGAYGDQPGAGEGARRGQPADGEVPQPALGPAVHPRPRGQPGDRRRRPVAAGRRAGSRSPAAPATGAPARATESRPTRRR